MDDLENKLSSILSNPEMMQQIMTMAQSFGGSQGQPAQDSAGPDPETLRKLSGLMGQTAIDPQQQSLLQALSPYLSRQRIQKLERAMRAARMANMATALFPSGR